MPWVLIWPPVGRLSSANDAEAFLYRCNLTLHWTRPDFSLFLHPVCGVTVWDITVIWHSNYPVCNCSCMYRFVTCGATEKCTSLLKMGSLHFMQDEDTYEIHSECGFQVPRVSINNSPTTLLCFTF